MTKRFLKTVSLLLATGAVATMIAAPAQAESKKRFCKTYAKIATRQYYEAKASGCGFSGAYWHPLKGAHKAWCMAVPRDQAEDGHAYRANKLNRCQGVEEGD